MRFLWVGTTPWRGGTETHFVALASALAAAGHDVAAVVHRDAFIAHGLAGSGVELHHAFFRNAADPVAIHAVLRVARRYRPDWLVGDFGKEYWPLLLTGRMLRIPVALFHHRAAPLRWQSAYLVPRLAQRFFAASEYVRGVCIAHGAPAGRVRVSYNPVDVGAYCPDAAAGRASRRELLGLGDGAIVLGFAGRVLRSKGVFVLVDALDAAMTGAPRLHCAWIGEGDDLAELRKRVAAGRFPDRHHFTGWVRHMAPCYRALSMLALPSLAPEAFGRTLIEAQACGVPVLASDHSGIREALAPGVGGELLSAGDVMAWRDAIVRFCDAALRARMGRAGRAFVVQRFSTDVVAAAFLASLDAAA